jgi:tetratricopeptide (TPR) repeat protein
VRHIQTRTEADAKKVKSLTKIKDWVALAKQYSTDTLTKATGGNLGVVTKDGAFGSLGTQPALAESAFKIPEGKVGGPYRSDRGWHVLRVDQVRPESTRPFDQVKPLIGRQLGSQHQQDYYKQQLEQARRSAGVTVDSAAVKRFISQKRSARDMFNDAQALGPADQRIAAYQDLLQQYPNSDVSAQAQFMIGFIYSEELKKYDDAELAFRTLLQKYPKAELAPSAQWMIDHMRSNDTPAFVNAEADSLTHTPATSSSKGHSSASNRKPAAQPQATVPSTPPNYRP